MLAYEPLLKIDLPPPLRVSEVRKVAECGRAPLRARGSPSQGLRSQTVVWPANMTYFPDTAMPARFSREWHVVFLQKEEGAKQEVVR